MRVMTMKGYSTFPKAPTLLYPHHQSFNVISRTLVRRVLPLCSDSVGAFCSRHPQPTGSPYFDINYYFILLTPKASFCVISDNSGFDIINHLFWAEIIRDSMFPFIGFLYKYVLTTIFLPVASIICEGSITFPSFLSLRTVLYFLCLSVVTPYH